MKPIHSVRALASIALLSTAMCTACAGSAARVDDTPPPRQLYVMNATPEAVALLDFSLDRGASFQTMSFSEPLRGLGGSRVLKVPAGSCLQDIRVQFVNHKELTYRNFDVCHSDRLRIAEVP